MVGMQQTWSVQSLKTSALFADSGQAARFPAHTFASLKNLLGQDIHSESAKEYLKLFPANKMVNSTRNTIAFEHETGHFTVEELVAMQLINMRKNAEAMAEEQLRDAILTVPPYFNQAQRLALLDSANLAGLRPLELINDGLAIALDYAKARTFEEPQLHVIFDMGAGSTTATVVKFSTKTVKDIGRFNKTVTILDVLGTGYSLAASGNAMTERLYSYMLAEFDNTKQATTSISDNTRATARLWREATRVKQVLSANSEAMISLESLHEDVDFRHRIARSKFEELNDGLGTLSARTVSDALVLAGVTVEELQSLILHGGAARVPFVQKALLEIIPEDKIARNVNADEAAVMGAVFRGAGLSGSFRVKELVPQDVSMYSYSYETTSGMAELFPRLSPLSSVKNLTFSSQIDDLEISFAYGQHDALSEHVQLSNYRVSGIANASAGLSKDYGCDPEVKVLVSLDNSGIIRIANAYVHCEIQEKQGQGVAKKLKGWFGGKETTTAVPDDSAADIPTEPEIRTIIKRSNLGTQTNHDTTLDSVEVQHSLNKIKQFEKHDSDRIALETARNGLEALVYRVRDYLENESFLEVSTAAEQDKLKDVSAAANDWMYAEGDTAALSDFAAKRGGIARPLDSILLRQKELAGRDEKISGLQKQIASTRDFIRNQTATLQAYAVKSAQLASEASVKATTASTVNDTAQDDQLEGDDAEKKSQDLPNSRAKPVVALPEPIYNEDDLLLLTQKLDDIERWLFDKQDEQARLLNTDEPVLLISDLESRTGQISDELVSVVRKATYRQQLKARAKTSESKSRSKSKTKTGKKSGSTSQPIAEDPVKAKEVEVEQAITDTQADDPAPLPDVETEKKSEDESVSPPETAAPQTHNERDEL